MSAFTLRAPGVRKRARNAGFTVVELLVSLGVFALVATLLFSGVRFGFAAWQKGAQSADDTDGITIEQTLLRRLIRDAYPQFVKGGDLRGHVDFSGDRDSMNLLAPAPQVLGGGGRFRFTLSLKRDDNGRAALELDAWPELADPESQEARVRRKILDDVGEVEFAYFGSPAAGRAPLWQDTWKNRIELPQLVRIRFSASLRKLHKPDMIVAPRVTADVSCVFDLLTARCVGR